MAESDKTASRFSRRSFIKTAGAGALTAYVDTVSATPLLEPLPKPGAVAATTSKPSGITEWTLSNGVRVVLEPTTFKQDEILFRAFSPGGTSLAPDGDFVAAETADQIVAQGGLGKLTAIDLGKKLAGKAAFVSPAWRWFTLAQWIASPSLSMP
jgi:zinc protease